MGTTITDMHFHTNYSDWRLDNNEILSKISKKSWWLYIATDHDIINSDFTKLAIEAWLRSCEWVEISILDEKCWYIHITAYAKKFNTEILAILEKTRNWRRSRLYKQIWVLKSNWIHINEDDFFSFFEEKWINVFNLNVYHLASFIYRFEYNRNLIEQMTWIKDKVEFLKRCLRNEWDHADIWSAYIEEYTPSTETIIQSIHNNDWICSIAHPNFTFSENDYENNINRLLEMWFDAIEINSKATELQVKKALKMQKKCKMLTFWSDCHFTPYSEADHWDFMNMNPYLGSLMIKRNIGLLIEKIGIN